VQARFEYGELSSQGTATALKADCTERYGVRVVSSPQVYKLEDLETVDGPEWSSLLLGDQVLVQYRKWEGSPGPNNVMIGFIDPSLLDYFARMDIGWFPSVAHLSVFVLTELNRGK